MAEQQLATRGQQNFNTLAAMLEQSKSAMAAVLPKFLSPEKLVKVALMATRKNAALLECNPQSVLRSIMISAELGLEPGGPLGHMYLVPYKGECTPIVGYQGLVELCHRSGRLMSIGAWVVHENEKHRVKFGKQLILWHEPCLVGDPGKSIFGYALAELRGGGKQAAVMTCAEILKIRDASAAYKSGRPTPWRTHEEEMMKKTVIRRLAKLLPKSSDYRPLARALEVDDEADGFIDVAPSAMPELDPKPKTRTEEVREAVTAEAAKGEPLEDFPDEEKKA